MKQGQIFTKRWTFVNDGDSEWPQDVKFAFVSGDSFGENEKTIDRMVWPGEHVEITVEFRAP